MPSSSLETAFVVWIPFDTKEDAEEAYFDITNGYICYKNAEVREVAK